MLLVTESHYEFNAGMVISIGDQQLRTPPAASAQELSVALHDRRLTFIRSSQPPANPTKALQSGLLLTPLLGAVATSALDQCTAWALYGEFCLKAYWPVPELRQDETKPRWRKFAHPANLSPLGQHRQPSLTRWARATFEQAALSLLPQLEGTVKAMSLPGKGMFQEPRCQQGFLRPAILHSYGTAKADAAKSLETQASHGCEPLAVCLHGV
eukprot:Skav226601  [mRNA]  locus=scaffold848:274:909:- [translate_table: standard]